MNSTIYVLVFDAKGANLMAGRSFEVAGEVMCFLRMLSIEQRSKDDESTCCDKVWPISSLPQ